ncbi:GHKL domain-containing protein [Bacillus spongiae]|uniref:GHKL domain-containing protein n=1 Tax=Bacillus spongiae TaxID=2683610 RepID=A0ABU8HDJ3_9BACI
MKRDISYWLTLSLFGLFHVQAFFQYFRWPIPFYFTYFVLLAVMYYLYKQIPLRLFHLGYGWNGFLFVLQIFLLFLYREAPFIWELAILLFLFIGIEGMRLSFSNTIATQVKAISQFEEEKIYLNETFQIVRSERHDFLKHIASIHFMLENDKYTDARHYLDDLVDGYEETNLSIKGERGSVAGILHQMYRRAKEEDISIVYDLDIALSTLPIPDQRLVALLGNLLSNSIDACEEWQKQHRKQADISLQFYKRSGLYVLICKNNSLPIPTNILDKLYQQHGHTTKRDHHKGLGTKIIQDTVKEHQGFLDFVYKDEEFTVKIKFPAIH